MNVLYILEPAIELNNPEFRFSTLRNSLIHQISALRLNKFETHLIIGEAVARRAMQEGYLTDLHSISTIDHFEWTCGENTLERAIRHQSENYKIGEIDYLTKIIKSKVPSNFSPDIIFVWESPMYFLSKVFPKAKIIYQTPGFFSRPPFPELIKFDVGLLNKADNSVQTLNKKSHIDNVFNELRNYDKKFFQSLNLVEPLVSGFRHKFQGLVLLPLQVDNYFMVDFLLQRKSQFDFVLDFLYKTPSSIGVVVTNYWSGKLRSAVLSDENLRYLRERFKNFIYVEKFNAIQTVSQLLLPHVDGVYTISSSVGYQAAYWGKPLLSLPSSHITKFNTADNLNDFLNQVANNISFYQDDLIKQDLVGSNFPAVWIKEDPKKFLLWLETFSSLPKKSRSWTSDSLFLQDFVALRRENSYLKNSGFEKIPNLPNSLTHCSELSVQIQKHEVISFDIFDTLLCRPFKSPSDIFDFMADDVLYLTNRNDFNFKDLRRQSEKLAFEAALGRGEGETHIDEIYKFFQILSSCTNEEVEQIKMLEMKLEYDLLYERKSAKTAFNQALSMGKRVIIISDMYLPRLFLEKILHKNGYKGYERIFVSSEIKLKKHNGQLYDHVLIELGVNGASILHIGDNLQADVVKAKDRGIKAFHLVKALEVFEKSDAYKTIWNRDQERHSLDAKMLLTLLGNTLHDNPYLSHRRGTLFSGDAWRLGYYGFGILLLGYVKWLMTQAIRDKIDRLYFLSRDGLIVKKAYDLLAKNNPNAPKSHYLLCSRRAVNLAKIKNESGIADLLNVDFSQTSLSQFLNARFGLKLTDIDEAVLAKHSLTLSSSVSAKHRSSLKEILLAHKEKIFFIAKQERDNYLPYLESEKLFNEGNVAVVDIGYAGTMQESLFELTDCRKPIQGYYLMTFRQALRRVERRGLYAKAYLGNFIDRHDTFHPFCKFVPLYETLFSNTETTFLRMEKDWNGIVKPIFMNRSSREEDRENLVIRVHTGAIQFVDTAISVLGVWFDRVDIEPNKSIRVLDQFFSNPHPVDAQIMLGVIFEDSYGGSESKIILSSNDNEKVVWTNGFRSIKLSTSKNNEVSFEKSNEKKFPFLKKGLDFLFKKYLSQKKYKKFLNSPKNFFNDSNFFGARFIGRIYHSD